MVMKAVSFKNYNSMTYKYETKTEPFDDFFSHDPGYFNGIHFAFEEDDQKYLKGYKGACHSGMSSISSIAALNKIVRWYSQLRCGAVNNRPAAERYWSVLFSDVSPFRNFFNDLQMHRTKEGLLVAFSLKIDDKTPNQVITNLGIMSRFPYEHPSSLDVFINLLNKGVDPIAALYLCHHISKRDTEITIKTYDPGHHALTPLHTSWSLFKKGEPKYNPQQTVRTGSSYMPNNAIWYGDAVESIHAHALNSNYNAPKVFELLYKRIAKIDSKTISLDNLVRYAKDILV